MLDITTRGFTGHEHVEHADIIHMNGRIFDPTLGRFLQADPFVQAPENSQSLNRYSYVLNNPLSYTDPSGYLFSKLFRPFKNVIRSIARILGPTVSSIASAFVCMGNPACIGVLQYDIARAHGASPSGALRGAFTAAASAFVFQQIGAHYKGLGAANVKNGIEGLTKFGGNMLTSTQIAGQIASHAVAGGVISVVTGGKFGHGFFSAGFTKGVGGAFLPAGSNLTSGEVFGGAILSAVLGGTVSAISGGKFANGAQTGAFQFLFNQISQPKRPDLGTAGNAIRARLTSDYEKELFERYWQGLGNKTLTQAEFDAAVNALNTSVVSRSQVTINDNQYTKTVVSFYNNVDLDQAYGSATVFFDSNGQAAGFFDTYNFDSKSWGTRPLWGELQTRGVKHAGQLFGNASPYEICYGVGC